MFTRARHQTAACPRWPLLILPLFLLLSAIPRFHAQSCFVSGDITTPLQMDVRHYDAGLPFLAARYYVCDYSARDGRGPRPPTNAEAQAVAQVAANTFALPGQICGLARQDFASRAHCDFAAELRRGPVPSYLSISYVHCVADFTACLTLTVICYAVFAFWWRSRSAGRVSAGLCSHCGHDLRGTVSDRCSECGAPIRAMPHKR